MEYIRAQTFNDPVQVIGTCSNISFYHQFFHIIYVYIGIIIY